MREQGAAERGDGATTSHLSPPPLLIRGPSEITASAQPDLPMGSRPMVFCLKGGHREGAIETARSDLATFAPEPASMEWVLSESNGQNAPGRSGCCSAPWPGG